MTSLFQLLALISLAVALYRRSLRYLRYLQQEEYSPARFVTWWRENQAWDTRITAAAVIPALLSLIAPLTALLIFATAMWIIAVNEGDARRTGKLPLRMTDRAQRILRLHLTISAGLGLLLVQLPISLAAAAAIAQALPFVLCLAVLILQRDEKKRQAIFTKEAKQRLQQVQPYVIGITGSYGKTSTKSALGQVLQLALAPTFWPEKGINTDMGIVRAIREGLHGGTKYAVIEMGAYGVGSISRLCKLTPPQAAIITAIGSCHLERFGSRDKIYQAKSELAQTLPEDGILVCCGDDSGARRICEENLKELNLLYGMHSADLDCRIAAGAITEKGTEFTITWKGKTYSGLLPQWGDHALLNAAGAFTMACALGADPQFAAGALGIVQAVDNRLQVETSSKAYTLRDAYNSNPAGFSFALDVLEQLPAQRRILMTPGMIELGLEQEQRNFELAEKAAGICDEVIVVGPTNRKALVKGLTSGGLRDGQIHVCKSREDAFSLLGELRQSEDSLLIENDLTDLYETVERF